MMICRNGIRNVAMLAVVAVFLSIAPTLASADVALRSGVVFEVLKSGVWTWVGAHDDDGKEFWVMVTNCTVGSGGHIEVIEGALYEKLKVESLDRVFEDCYEGTLIRVNGQEFRAYGVHGLPDGCIDLGGAAI